MSESKGRSFGTIVNVALAYFYESKSEHVTELNRIMALPDKEMYAELRKICVRYAAEIEEGPEKEEFKRHLDAIRYN